MMEQELRVRVLGGAELTVGGRPLVELASAKAAALLVYLAVTGGTHSRSALAGLLWSDLPEATARANLRLVLTKLRRVLPGHLEVTRQTVALAPGLPVWVDAAEVARVAAGQRGAAEPLAAVRLCCGEFLEGFGVPGASLFDEWLAGRRAAARADMLAVMDRAVQLARGRGDAASGVEVARRMLELEPLHEEAHRALMWFLARGGQRSAALAQYETCRYVLGDELGIEPSAGTVALRDEIAGAGGFTELDARTPAGAGRGGRAAPADPPRPLTTLVGRQGELARLGELLDDPACRLVTLVGPGGIGKTRLAVEVAAVRQGRHRDGTVFVSFVGTSPARPEGAADLVVADLARALGVSLAVPRDPLELLADHLGGRELLLVLDNLEQLRDAAGVLAELLRRAPAVQVLATSRRRLGVGVEWLVEVPGLPYPPAGREAVARYEAVELFEQRARLVRPGFRAAAEPEAVGRICRLVGGVPLAIELAAQWMRSASATAVAERLAGGLDLLTTTAPDVERRHRSVRTVMDWSWKLLTDEARRTLRRLSVFRGRFGVDDAAAVGVPLPALAALVDHSLAQAGEDDRYGLHELVRQYAAERLAADPGEQAEARRRHADHYVGKLEALPADGALELDGDAENLRAATEWMLEHAEVERLDAHLVALWGLHRRQGWFREAIAVLAAAQRRDGVAALERARWHRLAGEAHLQLGELARCREHVEQTLALLGRPPPASTAGWAAKLSGQVLRQVGHRCLPGGRAARAEKRRRPAGERAHALWLLGEVCFMLEEPLPLTAVSFWALNEAERSGLAGMIATGQVAVGLVCDIAGVHGVASRYVRAAEANIGRSDDPVALGWVNMVAGMRWVGTADWAAAERALARGVEAGRRFRLHRIADQALLMWAVARSLTSRYEEADAMAVQGLEGRHRGDPSPHLWGLVVRAEAALPSGRHPPGEVESWLEEAAGLLSHNTPRVDRMRTHAAVARLALQTGRAGRAWEAISTAAAVAGGRPLYAQFGLEAHAAVPEVCLALLERADAVADPAALRATAAAGRRSLRAFARAFPMARPRALVYLGWSRWLAGRRRAALRAWARAVREAERLRMPYELARAHDELGRHLAAGERSPLGLDRAGHLERALAGFRAAGCAADERRVQALTGAPAPPG